MSNIPKIDASRFSVMRRFTAEEVSEFEVSVTQILRQAYEDMIANVNSRASRRFAEVRNEMHDQMLTEFQARFDRANQQIINENMRLLKKVHMMHQSGHELRKETNQLRQNLEESTQHVKKLERDLANRDAWIKNVHEQYQRDYQAHVEKFEKSIKRNTQNEVAQVRDEQAGTIKKLAERLDAVSRDCEVLREENEALNDAAAHANPLPASERGFALRVGVSKAFKGVRVCLDGQSRFEFNGAFDRFTSGIRFEFGDVHLQGYGPYLGADVYKGRWSASYELGQLGGTSYRAVDVMGPLPVIKDRGNLPRFIEGGFRFYVESGNVVPVQQLVAGSNVTVVGQVRETYPRADFTAKLVAPFVKRVRHKVSETPTLVRSDVTGQAVAHTQRAMMPSYTPHTVMQVRPSPALVALACALVAVWLAASNLCRRIFARRGVPLSFGRVVAV